MTDPNAPRTFRLRATYVERGRLALLSHLEVARALERTVRRAGLPFAVSQGFSPHMKIAFGAALPVGVGSTCEMFDVQLTDYRAPDEVLAALQAASVDDLMVQKCRYIASKEPAASIAFPFSTYEARLSRPVHDMKLPETITVVRKRKEKVLVVDEYLVEPPAVQGEAVTFTLEAKPTGSLRADVFMANCDFNAELVSLTRVKQEESHG